MIRILYLAANPIWTAIEQSHATLIRALDPGHFEAHVAATSRLAPEGRTSTREHVNTISCAKKFETSFGPSFHGVTARSALELLSEAPMVPLSFLKLVRYVLAHEIDVIHFSQKPQDASFGIMLAKATKRKSVLHMHVKCEQWLTRPVRWALEHADRVVCVSNFTAESVAKGSRVPSERIRTVLNAFDIDSWSTSDDGEAVRKEFGIDSGVPLLATIGRLNMWKGQADLIEALPLVLQANPNVKLLVVGEEDPWSQGSTGYRDALVRRARELAIDEHVIFAGRRHDIPRVLAAADLFTCPTWEEPFGMVFVEAMAARKPVIAVQSGAAPEIVIDGETGLLVAPKVPRLLADAVNRLLADRSLALQFGQAGRARVESIFSPTVRVRELEDVYRELMRR